MVIDFKVNDVIITVGTIQHISVPNWKVSIHRYNVNVIIII